MYQTVFLKHPVYESERTQVVVSLHILQCCLGLGQSFLVCHDGEICLSYLIIYFRIGCCLRGCESALRFNDGIVCRFLIRLGLCQRILCICLGLLRLFQSCSRSSGFLLGLCQNSLCGGFRFLCCLLPGGSFISSFLFDCLICFRVIIDALCCIRNRLCTIHDL